MLPIPSHSFPVVVGKSYNRSVYNRCLFRLLCWLYKLKQTNERRYNRAYLPVFVRCCLLQGKRVRQLPPTHCCSSNSNASDSPCSVRSRAVVGLVILASYQGRYLERETSYSCANDGPWCDMQMVRYGTYLQILKPLSDP
jgi:hypothetical protein